jgi:hypothetical protein
MRRHQECTAGCRSTWRRWAQVAQSGREEEQSREVRTKGSGRSRSSSSSRQKRKRKRWGVCNGGQERSAGHRSPKGRVQR